jgi:cytochrome c553
MHKAIIAIACLAIGMLVATPAWVQDQPMGKIVLKSTSVDLPAGDSLFPGPSADAINNNCLACHSSDMVLNQPALPRATWEAEVHKMITAYKAPVDEKDVGAIVDYLVKTEGRN